MEPVVSHLIEQTVLAFRVVTVALLNPFHRMDDYLLAVYRTVR